MLLAIPLMLFPLGSLQLPEASVSPRLATGISLLFVQNKPKPDYDRDVLIPLRAAQKVAQDKLQADCEAQNGTLNGSTCVLPPPPVPIVVPAPIVIPAASGDAKGLLYEHESGNNPGSINKSSGACGIGQALPCSKLPCSLSDYACQDDWFTNSYMIPRYGSWEAAWAYWNCIGYCTNKYGTIVKTATWW